jgi:hypothetical protein
MPSSLNLFIRIPKGFSEQDVFDAIDRKEICKIIDVVIKKGKTTNNAIIMIDYWYKGTRHIRDTLMNGGPISVIVGSHMLLAYEFKPKPKVESAKVHPDQDQAVVDEFGRDVPRKSNIVLRADAPAFKPALRANAPAFKPILRADAPAFVPIAPLKIAPLKIAPALSDINQRLNEFAADAFIRQCEQECLANLKKMNEQGAIAPSAPIKASKPSVDDLEEGELREVVQKLDTRFIEKSNMKSDISKNKKVQSADCIHISAVMKRKVKFSLPTNK